MFEPLPPAIPTRDRRTVPLREGVGWVLLFGAIIGVLLLGMAPTSFVIQRPGMLFDTLGEVEHEDGSRTPLIDIPDASTYPGDGQLELVTVNLLGSPMRPVTVSHVLAAWFQPGATLIPLDRMYPDDLSTEDVGERSRQQMEASKVAAVAAAFTALGIDYGSRVEVVEVSDGGPADGAIEVGDVIRSIGGEPVSDSSGMRSLLADHGTGTPVEIVVDRAGVETVLSLTPARAADGDGVVIGVFIVTDFDFPVEVDIELDNVGGPSAGLMFSLGVYELLTPGSLTGGARIAGTGEITAEGEVGSIGGIRQKMFAAKDAGADWFLLPLDNCREAVPSAPAGLELVAVANLGEAIAALEAISTGTVDAVGLPRCTNG